LIFTSLDSMLGSAEVGGLLSEMSVLVADKNVEVRSAAGKVVALLCRQVVHVRGRDAAPLCTKDRC